MNESISNPMTFGKEITIIRQRFIIDYSSTSNKYLSEEYTLRCLTQNEEGIDNVFIRSPKLLPNLKVFDGDGTQLALSTNRLIKALIINLLRHTKPGESKKELGQLLADVEHQKIFLLWIKLPHTNRFFNNEIRVISLEYDASEDDVSGKDRFMEFHSAPYEVFYSITPPEDFIFNKKEMRTFNPVDRSLKIRKKSWDFHKEDPCYFNPSQNSIFVRIRPNTPDLILFTYSFKPKNSITALPKAILGILIAGSFLVLLSNLEPFLTNCEALLNSCWITNPIKNRTLDLGVGIIASSFVAPRLIRNIEIRDGLKFLYMIPVAIAIVGIFI